MGTVEQLVLPEPCRKAVLRLAHEIPLAGHVEEENSTQDLTMILLAQPFWRRGRVHQVLYRVPKGIPLPGEAGSLDPFADHRGTLFQDRS